MKNQVFTHQESVLLRYLPEYARAIEGWNSMREQVEILARNIQSAHVDWMGWSSVRFDETHGDETEDTSDDALEQASENLGMGCLDQFWCGFNDIHILEKCTKPALVNLGFEGDDISRLFVSVDFQSLSKGMGPGNQPYAAGIVAKAHPGFAIKPWIKLDDRDDLRINSHWGFKRSLRIQWDRIGAPIPNKQGPHPWCPDLLPCLCEVRDALRAVHKIMKD